ncbi:hypothetical protein IWW36_004544 [Coemansia brasiliensis]|uniref:Nudix hydrolase domain-containing protein n=1 Tax=Coemansia brasiliensis TaxID=2650707 RepID=A0A9W8LW59_9FUNG|nr:hypothetical protein IWW36_004544 [Coemansia brasiliensis]
MATKAAASLIVTAPRAALKGRAASQQKSAFDYGVLMVRRRTGGSFGSALVFPGGIVEPQDQLCPNPASACAVRETFEETGLLLADASILNANDKVDPVRLQAVAQSCPLLGTQALARWVTPRAQKKRFDTWFMLLNLPDRSLLLDRLQKERLQVSEVVELDWFAPDQLLLANRRAQMPLYPPQLYVLLELARFPKHADLCKAASQLSRNPDYAAVEPVLVPRGDGKVVALLPGDCAYSPTEPQVPEQYLYGDKLPSKPLHRLEMSPAAKGGFVDARLFRTGTPKPLSSHL